ncbi:hypothetical protein GCM10022244_49130 [Streptomyces gulbargensis]|uniref:Uncharacterized protein n=1 Tax=Streptomyces gulbargensis TaxID=364901 RepID=A0ABP7N3N2_9ACTN
MITQGTRLTGVCDGCGGTSVRDVGQFFDRGLLRWSVEAGCEGCGDGWCEQGTGPKTPEDVRQALLRAHGAACLRLVPDGAPQGVRVLLALREEGGLSLADARPTAERLMAGGLVGTSVEMEVLATRLRRRGLEAVVRPDGP